ncbi:MAG TPA: DUF4198 domain-containing protein [Allosphingosinicella sp.]|nr:DUF4198 domain-containing protein [Allosphingosinicella sp.]
MRFGFSRFLVVLAATGLLATPAAAHRQWMLPSSTVVSGDGVWVTVDAAVSNDLFYFEHQPMRLGNVKAWAPDGSELQLQNSSTGRYRSTFDLQLNQRGTYRVANVGTGIGGTFKVGTEERRLPRGTTAEQLATAIPTDATDVRISESQNRVEFFVTSGEPTTTVLAPTNRGLEMVPVTHPNDLVVGEAARFRFLIDGRPAANIEVHVVEGGIRYRDQLNDRTLRTDANGELSVDWPNPGFYWLNAEASDTNTSTPRATQRRLNYVATLEVMPS